MDKQDFQKQDFMEILVRLPCHRDEKAFPSRRQTFSIAMENDYHRDEKNKFLYSKDSVDTSIHRMDFNLHN